MSDVFSLFDEEVNASKFDKVDGEKGSTLSGRSHPSINGGGSEDCRSRAISERP